MNSARGEIVPLSQIEEEKELKRRLEKLSRTYDLTTMKIFMTVEAMGEKNIYNTYDIEKKPNWDPFLYRREACRLDLSRHEKTRERYFHFLNSVGREEQGKQFYYAMLELLKSKGAVDVFPQSRSHGKRSSREENLQADTFCGQLCRLLDKKLDTWFQSFQAVNIRLTAHVKVSNFVRVLTGQIDLLCRKGGMLYAINVKVTGMATPRPMDLNELCLVKAMVIQNGLASPDEVICGLLTCHLGDERPVLRLWEYRPTSEMDRAIREADIDKMIDAGRLSQNHEMWPHNMSASGEGVQTARIETAPYNMIGVRNSNREPLAITDEAYNERIRNEIFGINENNRVPRVGNPGERDPNAIPSREINRESYSSGGGNNQPYLSHNQQNVSNQPNPSHNQQSMNIQPNPSYNQQSMANQPNPSYNQQGMNNQPNPSYNQQSMNNQQNPSYNQQSMNNQPNPSYNQQSMNNQPNPSYNHQSVRIQPNQQPSNNPPPAYSYQRSPTQRAVDNF